MFFKTREGKISVSSWIIYSFIKGLRLQVPQTPDMFLLHLRDMFLLRLRDTWPVLFIFITSTEPALCAGLNNIFMNENYVTWLIKRGAKFIKKKKEDDEEEGRAAKFKKKC